MKKYKIKKLFTACVMNIFDDQDNIINCEVKPDDIVIVSAETITNLQQIKEAYQVIDDKAETTEPAKSKSENKGNANSDEKQKS